MKEIKKAIIDAIKEESQSIVTGLTVVSIGLILFAGIAAIIVVASHFINLCN